MNLPSHSLHPTFFPGRRQRHPLAGLGGASVHVGGVGPLHRAGGRTRRALHSSQGFLRMFRTATPGRCLAWGVCRAAAALSKSYSRFMKLRLGKKNNRRASTPRRRCARHCRASTAWRASCCCRGRPPRWVAPLPLLSLEDVRFSFCLNASASMLLCTWTLPAYMPTRAPFTSGGRRVSRGPLPQRRRRFALLS